MTTATSHQKTFTPARIVALALITIVLSGLAYLRLASAPDAFSVPAGAKAGDIILEPCTYATEDGDYAADCGALVVPESRSNPQSRLIALPVTRIRALSENPGEPLFRFDGGPGGTNMEFSKANRFAVDRDVVLVGFRGVDGSSVLDCPEVSSAVSRSRDRLSNEMFRAYTDGLRSCAQRLTGDGADVTSYGLTQQVDDMEAARVALGYGRIDLLSESAGTRAAMIYSWRHPQSIHRSVMIGVNPPGHYLFDAATTDRQLARYTELCTADDACRRRTDDLAASMRKTVSDPPDRWGPLSINKANARIGPMFGLFETTSSAAPLSAPMMLDTFLSAAEGDASGLWLLSLIGDVVYPEMFTWGQWAAVGVIDADTAKAYFGAGGDKGSILGNTTASFFWGGGGLADAWPVNPDDAAYRKVRPSEVQTLLISGELDFSTPAEAATRELLPFLRNGHQVVLPGVGHTLSFYDHDPEGGTRLINTYLSTGRVDRSLYKAVPVDFTPGSTLTGMAKRIVGIMVALGLLTVVSLALMALRVHRRGQFGRVASVALRSVYAIVLGLGGWLLGVLVVLMALPGVSIFGQGLAVLGVGVPVALGVYWAWVHRDWSATAKRAGFAGVLGAGLAGAWLGFHTTTGLFALATAIAGAVAVANLAAIVFQIAWSATAATDDSSASVSSPTPLTATARS